MNLHKTPPLSGSLGSANVPEFKRNYVTSVATDTENDSSTEYDSDSSDVSLGSPSVSLVQQTVILTPASRTRLINIDGNQSDISYDSDSSVSLAYPADASDSIPTTSNTSSRTRLSNNNIGNPNSKPSKTTVISQPIRTRLSCSIGNPSKTTIKDKIKNVFKSKPNKAPPVSKFNTRARVFKNAIDFHIGRLTNDRFKHKIPIIAAKDYVHKTPSTDTPVSNEVDVAYKLMTPSCAIYELLWFDPRHRLVFQDEQIGDTICMPRRFKNKIDLRCVEGGWAHGVHRTCYNFKHNYKFIKRDETFNYYDVESGANVGSLHTYPRLHVAVVQEAATHYYSEVTLKDDLYLAVKRVSQLYRIELNSKADSKVVEALVLDTAVYMHNRPEYIKSIIGEEISSVNDIEVSNPCTAHAIRGHCCGIIDCPQDTNTKVTKPSTSCCDPDRAPVVGHMLSDCDSKRVYLNTQCEHSAYSAVTNRITREIPGMTDEVALDLAKFVQYFMDIVYGETRLEKVMNIDEYMDHLSGSKRKMMINALDTMRDQSQLTHKQMQINSFIKREKFFKPDFCPRLISASSPEMNTVIAPPLYSMEKLMKDVLCYYQRNPNVKNFQNVTYASGMDRNRLGAFMTFVESQHKNPNFIETDYTKFDAHCTNKLLTIELLMNQWLAPGVDWFKIMSPQFRTHAKCRYVDMEMRTNLIINLRSYIKKYGNHIKRIPSKIIKKIAIMFDINYLHLKNLQYLTDIDGLIYADVGSKKVNEGYIRMVYNGRRHSGKPNTSSGNTAVSTMMQMYCLNRQFDLASNLDKWLMMACGDDTVISLDGFGIDTKQYVADMLSLGMVVKLKTPPKHALSFCSSLFIPCSVNNVKSYNLTQLPSRNLAKGYVTTVTSMTAKQRMSWVKQNADSYSRNFNHLPFMHAWHHHKSKTYDITNENVPTKAEIYDSYGRRMMDVNVRPKYTLETQQWLSDHYSFTKRDIDELRRKLSSNNVNWKDDLIASIWEVDTTDFSQPLSSVRLPTTLTQFNYRNFDDPRTTPHDVDVDVLVPPQLSDDVVQIATGIDMDIPMIAIGRNHIKAESHASKSDIDHHTVSEQRRKAHAVIGAQRKRENNKVFARKCRKQHAEDRQSKRSINNQHPSFSNSISSSRKLPVFNLNLSKLTPRSNAPSAKSKSQRSPTIRKKYIDVTETDDSDIDSDSSSELDMETAVSFLSKPKPYVTIKLNNNNIISSNKQAGVAVRRKPPLRGNKSTADSTKTDQITHT